MDNTTLHTQARSTPSNTTNDDYGDAFPPELKEYNDPLGAEGVAFLAHAQPNQFQTQYKCECVKLFADDQGNLKSGNDLDQVFTEDTFSLLYTAKFGGGAFWFSVYSLCVQVGLVLLLFFDLVDISAEPNETNNVPNRIKIPPGVSTTVTVGQLAGIFLTVYYMVLDGDTLSGITQLVEGYDKDILLASPHASLGRWLFISGLQILSGLTLTIASFFLMMQSETVIDLLLNLTGLHMLQEIDNLSFMFAATGILGTSIEKACDHVKEIKQEVPQKTKDRIAVATRLYAALLLIGLLLPFFILAGRQTRGDYLCQHVYVQFGDYQYDYPQYAYYSGVFYKQEKPFFRNLANPRPVYMDPTKSVRLAWCTVEGSWTFSNASSGDSCDFFYISSPTDSFDVVEIADKPWFVHRHGTDNAPVDWLKMVCHDCDQDRCSGICQNDQCIPDPDREDNSIAAIWKGQPQGLNLEFPFPACGEPQALIPKATAQDLDAAFKARVDFVPVEVNGLAGIIKNFMVYGSLSANHKMLVFSGRRWVLFEFPGLPDYDFPSILTLEAQQNNSVVPVRLFKDAGYEPIYFSSPVDYGKTTYQEGLLDLRWYARKYVESEPVLQWVPNEAREIDLEFTCPYGQYLSFCETEGNECWNGGECINNFCVCPFFYHGARCEYASGCEGPQWGSYINLDENFEGHYDGGDCFRGGRCGEDGTCRCPPGFVGDLCQYMEHDEVYNFNPWEDEFNLPCEGQNEMGNISYCEERELLHCGCICSFENMIQHDICTITWPEAYCKSPFYEEMSYHLGPCQYMTDAELECHSHSNLTLTLTGNETRELEELCHDITQEELECRIRKMDQGDGSWSTSADCEFGFDSQKTQLVCRDKLPFGYIFPYGDLYSQLHTKNIWRCANISRAEMGCRLKLLIGIPDPTMDQTETTFSGKAAWDQYREAWTNTSCNPENISLSNQSSHYIQFFDQVAKAEKDSYFVPQQLWPA